MGVNISFMAWLFVGELRKENIVNRKNDGEESVKKQHGRKC